MGRTNFFAEFKKGKHPARQENCPGVGGVSLSLINLNDSYLHVYIKNFLSFVILWTVQGWSLNALPAELSHIKVSINQQLSPSHTKK